MPHIDFGLCYNFRNPKPFELPFPQFYEEMLEQIVAAEALGFEAALERLEGLVDRLEDGDLELEESLGVFEQGVALSKQCAAKLESAERKVEQLVREGGEWLTRPFEDTGVDGVDDGVVDGNHEER